MLQWLGLSWIMFAWCGRFAVKLNGGLNGGRVVRLRVAGDGLGTRAGRTEEEEATRPETTKGDEKDYDERQGDKRDDGEEGDHHQTIDGAQPCHHLGHEVGERCGRHLVVDVFG